MTEHPHTPEEHLLSDAALEEQMDAAKNKLDALIHAAHEATAEAIEHADHLDDAAIDAEDAHMKQEQKEAVEGLDDELNQALLDLATDEESDEKK